MTKLESKYEGHFLSNARFLTKEEIEKKYSVEDNSHTAKLTHEFVKKGFRILYGETPKPSLCNSSRRINWSKDVLVTAAHLYKKPPDNIEVGAFTDLSQPNAIYAAVKYNR